MSCKIERLPFVMDNVPDEYIQVAQRELNETPEKRVQLLRDLKTIAKDDKTLSDIDFHQDFLLQFLRVSKFNIDLAFGRLQKYINFRRKHLKFFTGVEDRISSTPAYRWVSPLPWRSTDGSAVGVMKFGEWDIRDISYDDLHRLCHTVLQQGLRDPMSQITGLKLIMDFESTTYRHLKYATPGNLRQIAKMYLECTPLRFKEFHCVNCTLVMKIAWSIIAPFMSEKLRKRVSFHKHPEDLLNYFSKHVLPVEYGGEIKYYYMDSWMKESNYQIGLSTLGGQRNIY